MDDPIVEQLKASESVKQSLKLRKEDFVSNLAGGDISEINYVALVTPAAVLLWSALQSRHSFFTPYNGAGLVTDFMLSVGVILFATTLYSSTPVLLNILLISPALFIYFGTNRSRQREKAKPPRSAIPSKTGDGAAASSSDSDLDPFPIRPFLTTYRGTMMIATCLAILAVDFRVFPRRFAKVENWGTSIMDLGVGSFVFSAGVVSARAILKERLSSVSKASLPRRLVSSIRHSIPLFILGLVRLYSVKGLDYAEHVTEYGVHWNFFFTLAFLAPFVEIFDSLTFIIPSYEVLALLAAVAYQVALESTDLKAFILVSPRGDTFLSKNREGIFSFLGYLAIYLAGRGTGMLVIPRSASKSAKTPQQARKSLLIRMALWSVAWMALFTLNSTPAFGVGAAIPVSRRLANMPYVLWIAAFNNSQIFLFCLLETFFFPEVHKATDKATEQQRSKFATSTVMQAFNKNGLAIFLLANLLTGTVNMSMNTLDATNGSAMAVLICYGVALTGVALGLYHWNITLKI
ncbi:Glucosaminyl phosphatidylinositol (GlcN-PI) nositol acylation protein [Arachnomyces sp. PD_36]|nr:Glucosaminyl phosphatidylinositol (GlcN-PI) nositol acylation protein [Arachnomyces sp. PD_36]